MTNETHLRQWICEIGRRLYTRGLVCATDGNISVRLDEDRFLCTPGGAALGFMRVEDIVIADGRGGKVSGDGTVTSEFFTHLACYEQRPDRDAVVHAHPPHATAITLMGVDAMRAVLPELLTNLGTLPVTAYATPGTAEGADVVREPIRDNDALLLARHGALTLGTDLEHAYFNMERVEQAAHMHFLTQVR